MERMPTVKYRREHMKKIVLYGFLQGWAMIQVVKYAMKVRRKAESAMKRDFQIICSTCEGRPEKDMSDQVTSICMPMQPRRQHMEMSMIFVQGNFENHPYMMHRPRSMQTMANAAMVSRRWMGAPDIYFPPCQG